MSGFLSNVAAGLKAVADNQAVADNEAVADN